MTDEEKLRVAELEARVAKLELELGELRELLAGAGAAKPDIGERLAEWRESLVPLREVLNADGDRRSRS